jgi:hypothetical protein
MHKGLAMIKYFSSLLTGSGLLLSQACIAAEAPNDPPQKSYDVVEEVVYTGSLRKVHDSSFLRETQDRFECEGRTLRTTLTVRHDYSMSSQLRINDIEVSFDGQSIDVDNLVEILNSSDGHTDIGTQYYCLNSQIIMSVYAYSTVRSMRDSLIGEIYIDLDTGKLLSEARKAPKD